MSEPKKIGHNVRVSDEVFEEIQKRARPITDTVDSVLRRVLGLPEKDRTRKDKEDQTKPA